MDLLKGIDSFGRRLKGHTIGAFSAQAAFFIIVSAVPFAMFFLTLLRFFPVADGLFDGSAFASLPSEIQNFIQPLFNEVHQKTTNTVLSIAVITTLWSASKGILAILGGLDAVFEVQETRNYIHLRFLSILYTFVFSVALVITLAILVFGEQLARYIGIWIPHLKGIAFFVISIRLALGILLLTLFFLVVFLVAPNRKSKIFAQLPGAFFSAVGWVIFSYLYSFYIENWHHLSYVYGSLAALVLLMLWLYFCMYILFLGAEFNAWMARHLPKTKREQDEED